MEGLKILMKEEETASDNEGRTRFCDVSDSSVTWKRRYFSQKQRAEGKNRNIKRNKSGEVVKHEGFRFRFLC